MNKKEISNIISQVKSGDQNAFVQLVDLYKDMVYSLCLKMTQSSADAEELAQDSFVKAFQSIHKFKGESKFSTWLYQIAYYTTINFLRKNKIETTYHFSEDWIESDKSIISDIQQSERKRYINQAFEYLKPDERAVITLFHLEEHSIEEIAEITKLSKSNVKVKIHRTRKKLYGIMQSLLKNEVNSLV